MTKITAKDIWVDMTDGEIFYGHDQMYNTYPVVFPTVTFTLTATDRLYELADKAVREQNDDYYTDEEIENLCYFFNISINDLPDCKIDNCITVFDEGGAEYIIDLTEEERNIVYEVINQQCLDIIGKSCDELLAESRKEMYSYFKYLDNYKEG